MILTQCAVCATDLGLTLGKKCGRCSTRYCGPECQRAALERGRPRQALQIDKKAGGAEQYNANEKYAEAVAVRSRMRGRHEGPDVLHLHAGAPLENEGGPRARLRVPRDGGLRACVVSGGATAKILFAEAEENNKPRHYPVVARWASCSLCEQRYHGVVACALGWACWKTYWAAGDGR